MARAPEAISAMPPSSRVELAHGSARVVLGTANLNNGSDGGDRGPFTFTVTQEQLDPLGSP